MNDLNLDIKPVFATRKRPEDGPMECGWCGPNSKAEIWIITTDCVMSLCNMHAEFLKMALNNVTDYFGEDLGKPQ